LALLGPRLAPRRWPRPPKNLHPALARTLQGPRASTSLHIAIVSPELHSALSPTKLGATTQSLAQALHGAGQDVRLFLPWSYGLDTAPLGSLLERGEVHVPDNGGTQTFKVLEGRLNGMTVHLFDNEPFFASHRPYGDGDGPYAENWRRYSLFAKAVLLALDLLPFRPEVIHCMDWTTGLIPLYQELLYKGKLPKHPAARAGSFFGVHNLAIQGSFERDVLPAMDIPMEYFKQVGGVELAGKLNFLKVGVEFATMVGTHSPGHALKIQETDRGYGLEAAFLRRQDTLIGIHNGIDYSAWNPSMDASLPANFDTGSLGMGGKKKCKAALQASLKLDNGPRTPVACCIGRWDRDSGFDLVIECLTELLERGVELIIMGQGNEEISQRLRASEGAFPGRLRVIEGFNAHTTHLMMGGCDIMLLPYHYQPANSFFAIAMRYGVSPVIFNNGGLELAVVDQREQPDKGTGFQFGPYTKEGLRDCLLGLIDCYRTAPEWEALVERAMSVDYSWSATAAGYLKAYRKVSQIAKKERRQA